MKKGALFTTIGSIIILIISFIAFILPSSFGGLTEEKKVVFGKYKNREVRYEKDSDFLDNIQSTYDSYIRQKQGQEPSNSEIYDIYKLAYQNTISQYYYEDAVKKAGYIVPEESINRRIRALFTNEDGKFDTAAYKQADKDAISRYKKMMLDNSVANLYASDLFGSQTEYLAGSQLYGLKESDAELNFIADLDSDKREFNLVSFQKNSYPAEEIMNWANKNIAKFTKYNMSIITFTEKSVADKYAKKIADGKMTFEEVSAEVGDTKYKDSEGKLSYPYFYQYSIEGLLNNKEDIATLSNLKNDEISAVIELSNGYALYKKNADSVKADLNDESLIKDITTYVNTYENTMIENYYIALAKDFTAAAKAEGIDAACAKYNVEKYAVPAFALNYGGSTFASSVNSILPGLKFADTNEDFLKTAFTLKENEYSNPMVMQDDQSTGYVIILQYITSEDSEVTSDANMNPFTAYQISTYDQFCARNRIMGRKDVSDNFLSAYYGF